MPVKSSVLELLLKNGSVNEPIMVPIVSTTTGIYKCVKCGNDLFHGKSKYAHHTPWPAFSETVREDSVRKEIETIPQQSSKAMAMKVSPAT